VPARIADRLQDPPPDQIYVETSFAIDALVKPRDAAPKFAHIRHRGAVNLLERLEGKKTQVYFSPLLFVEFWDAVLKIELIAVHGANYHEQLRANPALVVPHFPRIQEADEALSNLLVRFPSRREVDPVRKVHSRALSLMQKYPLRSYDALHIASGLHAGVDNFAASDQHFEVVDGIIVWRSWG